jgi:hypothetical protein
MFALIKNGALATYPYLRSQLCADNPQTGFPFDLTGVDLSAFGVVEVAGSSAPAPTKGFKVVEASPAMVAGVWTQQWETVAQSSEDLSAAKTAEHGRVNQIVAAKTMDGGAVVTPSGTVQCDESSRVNITGAVVLAGLAPSQFSINWTMADNTQVTLNASAMVAMGQAVAGHVAAVHGHARALKDAIAAATTADQLASIDLESGWPA